MSVEEFPKIRVVMSHNIRNSIDGLSLNEAITNLIGLREEHGGEPIVEVSGEDVEVEIYVSREETDAEHTARAQRQMDAKRRAEEHDLRRYLELHAKFGGKIKP